MGNIIEQYRPITDSFGFIETDPNTAADCILNRLRTLKVDPEYDRETYVLPSYKKVIAAKTFVDALNFLLPLVAPGKTHQIILATKSKWSAYFDNFKLGDGAPEIIHYLARTLKVNAMSVHSVTVKPPWTFPAQELAVWGTSFDNYTNPTRFIMCLDDGGIWKFLQQGTPFDFEDTQRYKARRIKDRFTEEMLRNYVSALGLSPWDEDFYRVDEKHPAIGIIRTDTDPKILGRMKSYLLEDIRQGKLTSGKPFLL